MTKYLLPRPAPLKNPHSPFRNFNYIRPIYIRGSTEDLKDYQVKIVLNKNNFPLEKCRLDGSDIRFRDATGKPLPYWIQSWSIDEAVVWCKVPFISANSITDIWMIYGNSNAQSESDGNSVFELFNVQNVNAFWHLDESQWSGIAGEVKDETGINHGTAKNGAVTTADAKYKRAGLFDGIDSYVDCGNDNSLDITGEITIEAWFYYKEYTTYPRLVSKGHNSPWSIFFDTDDTVCVVVDNDFSGRNQVSITPNVWQHFVWTYYNEEGENKGNYYIDGELKLTVVGLADIPSNPSQKVGIGNEVETGFSRPFDGMIDEVRIYSRALTPTEIHILHDNYMEKMGSYFNVRKYVYPEPIVII